jgi:hypothetical protein
MDAKSQQSGTARTTGLVTLIALLILQGISAVGGGAVLVAAPDGSMLGMPLSALDGTPFPNFLIPGLILLVVLGITPLVIAYGLVRRFRWAWPAALLFGPALMVWIIVQILLIGYSNEPPLQAIYGALGSLILVVSILPSVRRAAGW